MEKIAPKEQFLLFSTIFCCLLVDLCVKTGSRFSLRDKRLFEISVFEITRVDCNCVSLRPYNDPKASKNKSNTTVKKGDTFTTATRISKGQHTSSRFPPFYKRDNFYTFLFAFLKTNQPPKRDRGSDSFFYSGPFFKRGANQFCQCYIP